MLSQDKTNVFSSFVILFKSMNVYKLLFLPENLLSKWVFNAELYYLFANGIGKGIGSVFSNHNLYVSTSSFLGINVLHTTLYSISPTFSSIRMI